MAKRKISSVHYNDTNCNVDGRWFTTEGFTDDVEHQKQIRSDQQEAINRSKYFFAFAFNKSSEKRTVLDVYDDDKYLADNLYGHATDRDYSFAEFLKAQKEKR